MANQVTAQFENEDGQSLGPVLALPADISPMQLELALKQLMQAECQARPTDELEDALDVDQHYSFYIDDVEILQSIQSDYAKVQNEALSPWTERMLRIRYQKQALFRVKCATRCSSTLSGHAEAVLIVAFSPDGKCLVSGSGDATVRWWDLATETPFPTSTEPGATHASWVLALAWSPCGNWLASGGMDNMIILWDTRTRKPVKKLRGHSAWIQCLIWQPLHLASLENKAPLLASGSKDGSVRIWDPVSGQTRFSIGQHSLAVTCLRWSGHNILYSVSRDRYLKAWHMGPPAGHTAPRPNISVGQLLFSSQKHAHWINAMALDSDALLRFGPYDPNNAENEHLSLATMSFEEKHRRATDLFKKAKLTSDRLVTASDDATLFLWTISYSGILNTDALTLNPVRLTGHQALINDVAFSPDNGHYIVSASFDKSLRLWDGRSGKFLSTLKSHTASIYRVAWSADARLFASASKDSTVKIWNRSQKKCIVTLPGHRDEVFALDWSPDGQRLASGSKDKTLKIWRN
jgi:ribosome assembly protein 4